MEERQDLISRQAAIDAVEHITSSMSVCVNTDECHGMKRMQRQAIIELANLPSARPEQRWIPWSSGKLPEESGIYTVTAYDGVTKRVTYAKYQKRLKRWELTGAYWRVLAWMPLPEPYGGDNE